MKNGIEERSQVRIPALLYADWENKTKKKILKFILLYFVINLLQFVTFVFRNSHL